MKSEIIHGFLKGIQKLPNRGLRKGVRNVSFIHHSHDGPPPTLLLPRPPVKAINEEILNQVVLMGFDRETSRSALLANDIHKFS
jgi:hypothetical protein